MTSTTLMKTLGSYRKQKHGFPEFEVVAGWGGGAGGWKPGGQTGLQSNLALPDITREEMDAQGGAYVIALTLVLHFIR